MTTPRKPRTHEPESERRKTEKENLTVIDESGVAGVTHNISMMHTENQFTDFLFSNWTFFPLFILIHMKPCTSHIIHSTKQTYSSHESEESKILKGTLCTLD